MAVILNLNEWFWRVDRPAKIMLFYHFALLLILHKFLPMYKIKLYIIQIGYKKKNTLTHLLRYPLFLLVLGSLRFKRGDLNPHLFSRFWKTHQKTAMVETKNHWFNDILRTINKEAIPSHHNKKLHLNKCNTPGKPRECCSLLTPSLQCRSPL